MDIEEIVDNFELLGDWDARLIRYSRPWKQGRVVEEATLVKQDDHFCVIVGSCHTNEHSTFATTYTLIVQSLLWTTAEPPR